MEIALTREVYLLAASENRLVRRLWKENNEKYSNAHCVEHNRNSRAIEDMPYSLLKTCAGLSAQQFVLANDRLVVLRMMTSYRRGVGLCIRTATAHAGRLNWRRVVMNGRVHFLRLYENAIHRDRGHFRRRRSVYHKDACCTNGGPGAERHHKTQVNKSEIVAPCGNPTTVRASKYSMLGVIATVRSRRLLL